MNMTYVRGGDNWAIPVWEKPADVEVAKWTRTMVKQTEKMRQYKDATPLTISDRLRRRLGLASPAVTLTVNGSVRLSSAESTEPLCILDV
jgi:hypothetical protein